MVLVILVGGAPAVRADCSQGVRPATAAEKTFQLNTLKAIKAAVPTAPAGWRIVEETDMRPPRLACIGQEREPLWFEYQIRFARADTGGDDDTVQRASLRQAVGEEEAQIAVLVNAGSQALAMPVETLAVPGVSLALRSAPAGALPSVRLLFGDWSLAVEADTALTRQFVSHFLADVPYTSVQSLAVQLRGDRRRTEAFLQQLDLKALGQLLYR
jgi:hypothetical protein